MEELKLKLSQIGDIQVINEGVVFTLLMTGKNLSLWKNVDAIQTSVLAYAGDRFPLIECMRNETGFFLIVLKPDTSDKK